MPKTQKQTEIINILDAITEYVVQCLKCKKEGRLMAAEGDPKKPDKEVYPES